MTSFSVRHRRLQVARCVAILLGISILLATSGCATVKYSALEKVGVHKRDLLSDRIRAVGIAQNDTSAQIGRAYEALRDLIQSDNQALEQKYNGFAESVAASEKRVNALDQKIAATKRVADDLFTEWRAELAQYTSASLREASAKNLNTTTSRFQSLHREMLATAANVVPILEKLQDRTLFLKHNLNANALAGLTPELTTIERNVARLNQDMSKARRLGETYISTP